MAAMNAAYITAFGPPEAIVYGPRPRPDPGPGEVLVRVAACSVNHVDTFLRSGAVRAGVAFPQIVGRDLVGVVVGTGAGVTGFAAGQRVWCNSAGYGGRQGAAAEYVPVPADRLYPLPAEADEVAAVALVHPAATAYLGLVVQAGVRPGETVLIRGLGGAVGSAAVQMAVDLGARVIGVDRAANLDWGSECGAAEVVDGLDPARLWTLAPEGVDVYWNTTTRHDDLATVCPLLAVGARILVSAGLGAEVAVPLGALYVNDASIRGFAITNATGAVLADAAVAIDRLLASGVLRCRGIERMPLAEAARAHRWQQDGVVRPRRIVLTP